MTVEQTSSVAPAAGGSPEHRAQAFRERVYSTFTGLGVLIALFLEGHATPVQAFLTLAAAVTGITLAGYVADVIGFQVAHRRAPRRPELVRMTLTALGALAASAVPLIGLALAWGGVSSLDLALRAGIAIHIATLVVVFVLAVHRSGLPVRQRVLSMAMLLLSAAAVVIVLVLAHAI